MIQDLKKWASKKWQKIDYIFCAVYIALCFLPFPFVWFGASQEIITNMSLIMFFGTALVVAIWLEI